MAGDSKDYKVKITTFSSSYDGGRSLEYLDNIANKFLAHLVNLDESQKLFLLENFKNTDAMHFPENLFGFILTSDFDYSIGENAFLGLVDCGVSEEEGKEYYIAIMKELAWELSGKKGAYYLADVGFEERVHTLYCKKNGLSLKESVALILASEGNLKENDANKQILFGAFFTKMLGLNSEASKSFDGTGKEPSLQEMFKFTLKSNCNSDVCRTASNLLISLRVAEDKVSQFYKEAIDEVADELLQSKQKKLPLQRRIYSRIDSLFAKGDLTLRNAIVCILANEGIIQESGESQSYSVQKMSEEFYSNMSHKYEAYVYKFFEHLKLDESQRVSLVEKFKKGENGESQAILNEMRLTESLKELFKFVLKSDLGFEVSLKAADALVRFVGLGIRSKEIEIYSREAINEVGYRIINNEGVQGVLFCEQHYQRINNLYKEEIGMNLYEAVSYIAANEGCLLETPKNKNIFNSAVKKISFSRSGKYRELELSEIEKISEGIIEVGKEMYALKNVEIGAYPNNKLWGAYFEYGKAESREEKADEVEGELGVVKPPNSKLFNSYSDDCKSLEKKIGSRL